MTVVAPLTVVPATTVAPAGTSTTTSPYTFPSTTPVVVVQPPPPPPPPPEPVVSPMWTSGYQTFGILTPDAYTPGLFTTPEAACQDQAAHLAGGNAPANLTTTLLDAAWAEPLGIPSCTYWYQRKCSWSVGSSTANSSLTVGVANVVTQGCYDDAGAPAPQYSLVAPGTCVKKPNNSRPPCDYNNGANSNPLTGDPVIVSTGALYERVIDYQSPDKQLTIARTYRSKYGGSAPTTFDRFGVGELWRFSFQWELAFDPATFQATGAFGVATPDGSDYGFVLHGDGSVTSTDRGVADVSVKFDKPASGLVSYADLLASGGRFTVTTSEGAEILMALYVPQGATKYKAAHPLKVVHRGGYTWNFTYGAGGELQEIKDSLGRVISVTWHTMPNLLSTVQVPRAIKTITLPDGTTLEYGYEPYPGAQFGFQGFTRLKSFTRSATASDTAADASWRALFWAFFSPASALPAVTAWPVVDSTTYVYDDPNSNQLLTGVLDNTGVRASTWQYDSSGRVISAQRANGADAVTIAYATDATGTVFTRTVTNALGKQTVFTFKMSPTSFEPLLTSVVGTASTSCAGTAASITYDSGNRKKAVTDEAGNVTGYTYGTDGRVKTITEATGTALQRATTYTWHATLGVPTKVVKPGLTTDYAYDSAGRLTSMTQTDTTSHFSPYSTNGRTRKWTYSYNAQGLRSSVDGPLAGALDSTSYDYDPQGHLTKVSNAVGHTWQVTTMDPAGRATTLVDPNGATTTLSYDGAGRLYHSITPETETTYLYDAVGNLGMASTSAGASITYAYDAARRLVELRDDAGNRVKFTLDADGNQKAVDVYDPSGVLRRTQTRVYDELDRLLKVQDPQQQETVLGRDALGNVTTSTRRATVTTTSQFDALNRLFMVTDPMAGVTSYQYDGGDHLVAVTDPRGKVTRYTVDGFGQVIQVVSPDAGTSVSTYDNARNLLTRRDAKSQTTRYAYDIINRPTLVTYADYTTVAFTYDEGVNGVGHLTTMRDATGTTTWEYDAAGHVVRKVQTVGSTILATDIYYQNGYLTGLRLPSGHFIDYFWAPSAVTGVNVDGAPLASDISSEPFGAPSSWTFANGEVVSKTYDSSGRMTAHDLGQLSYDTGDRITGWTPSAKSAVSYARNFGYDDLDRLISNDTDASTYSYDANGNRTNQTLTTWVLPTKISTTSNRITSGSDWFNPVLYSYDANGSVTKDPFLTYSYDTAGRLKTANTWDYAYNGLGQRVRKQHLSWRGDTTILFVYDEAGHLVGEYDGNGLPIQETVWLGDTPLAVLKPTGTYYVHADHLDTPRQISDGLGRTVWAWDAWDFGAGGAHQDLSGTEFNYNLRLPGQYFDSETGLHHNGHRTYAPYAGRYLESDPIGLRGGLNTYAYVGNNPLSRRDPSGLWEELLPVGMTIPWTPEMGPWSPEMGGMGVGAPPPQQPVELRSDGRPQGAGCGTADSDCYIPDKVPGTDFTKACEHHDGCFSKEGASRLRCEWELYKDMATACAMSGNTSPLCSGAAVLYPLATELKHGLDRLRGVPTAFDQAQQQRGK